MISGKPDPSIPPVPCDKCDEIRLTKGLEAQEAILAAGRAIELENEKSRIALRATDLAAEIESESLLHTSVAQIAKESIERSRDSAKYIQTAAAAIATLYTGVLALVFSVTDNPLPFRGVLAPLFLGLSIALATGYLAFVRNAPTTNFAPVGSSRAERATQRSLILTKYVNSTIFNKKWAIRASVISLGVGVAFIAAPFVAVQRPVIPDAPTAPAIPAAVAPELVEEAQDLFEAQTASFTAATAARNKAIESASNESVEAAKREKGINVVMISLALAGLAGVLLGPLIYAWQKEKGVSG